MRALRHAGSAWLAAFQAPPDDPRHVEVCVTLGVAVFHVRRYEMAAALFARALEALAARSPKCEPLDAGAAYNNLACCAAALNDAASAETFFRRAHALCARVHATPAHVHVCIADVAR